MHLLSDFLQSIPPFVLAVIKATLVLALIQLLVAAMPRLSASTKHLLLTLGITGFLVLPLVSLIFPSWDLALLPEAKAAAFVPNEDRYDLFSATGINDAPGETITVTAPLTTPRAMPLTLTPNPSPQGGAGLLAISIYAWMTVALLLVSRLLLGLLRVWWIIRTSEPVSERTFELADEARTRLALRRDVRLLSSDFVEVPMICGLFRPTLLLPTTTEEWPEDQLRVVLLHEFGHLKRWDALTLLLTNVVTSLYWFHPQIWFASLSTRRECERACDDLVLNTGTKPSDYAGTLLSMVRLMPEIEKFGAVTLGMSQRSQLEGRLLAILHPSVQRRAPTGKFVAVAVAAAVLLLGPLAVVKLTASAGNGSEGAPLAVSAAQLLPEFVPVENTEPAYQPDEEQDAEDGEEWFGRAYEAHHSGRFDEAIDAFKKAAAAGYKTEAAMYNVACGYSLKGDRENALGWLNRALENGFEGIDHLFEDSDLDPLRADPRFKTLLARYRDQYHAEEDDDHDQDYDKKDPHKKDRYEDSTQRFNDLRRERSTDGESWNEVGKELLSMRQLDDAIFALTRAVETIGYQNQNAMYNLACAYALNGNRDVALDWLERSIQAGYDDPGHMRKDSDLISLRGTDRFAQLVRLAVDLSLSAHQSQSMKDEEQYSKRRWASTVAHFDSYVRSHPTNGRAWFNLGFALHYSSEHQRAIDSFERSMRLGYRQPTAMYNIACGYAMLGQSGPAIDWLEKSEKAGFQLQNYIFGDEDLESLRTDPRFIALATRVAAEHGMEKAIKKLRVKDKRKSV